MKLTETAEIPLQNGHVALVDRDMLDELSAINWGAKINRNVFYASGWHDSKSVLMHRMVMKATTGQIVDHVNRNGLDNRRSNLRFVTRLQNLMNSGPKGGNRFKGLNFDKRCNLRPWQAIARVNGRSKSLGFYETDVEAAQAYDRAMVALHGEFAYLNFPALEKETRE